MKTIFMCEHCDEPGVRDHPLRKYHEECAEEVKAAQKRDYMRRRRRYCDKNNLCVDCSKPRNKFRTFCDSCQERRRYLLQQRRPRRNTTCVLCDTSLIGTKCLKYCKTCADDQQAKYWETIVHFRKKRREYLKQLPPEELIALVRAEESQ